MLELMDAGSQAGGALLCGEQVGLQGSTADGGPGAGYCRWLGPGSVELFEQVAVPVEERAVDSCAAGDAADADLLAAGLVGSGGGGRYQTVVHRS